MFSCIDNVRGQAAVEAAFLLPVFLLVLGLMLEPALLFYNRCVMNAAAAEGCRMLETNAADEASAKAFVLRRLAAIPNADAFHCGGKDAWDIELSGAEGGDVLQHLQEVLDLHRMSVFNLQDQKADRLAVFIGNKSS
jgi:hypothetical protein